MSFVFRAYGQAELDIQMNARATVPDIAPFIAAYRDESARMRRDLPCHIAQVYGASEPERLDIFPARETQNPAPVFVFLHGGYWRLLDAADSSFMAQTFTQAGACVVAVNYALAPGASLTQIVRQCRAALAWIYHHIARFGGDPARIHVSGSSAGGHLVGALLAPGWQAQAGVPETFIASASPLSGLFDLVPVQHSHVNGWLNLSDEEVETLSPLRHLPHHPLPLLVAYAPSETEEFKRQSEVYAAAAAARGCDVEIWVEPGTNHFNLPLQLMNPQKQLTQRILRLMGCL